MFFGHRQELGDILRRMLAVGVQGQHMGEARLFGLPDAMQNSGKGSAVLRRSLEINVKSDTLSKPYFRYQIID